METQTALAIPDEDDQMVVFCASQGTEYVQVVIAKCLGIPLHNVRVITRRLGGAFGGKMTRTCKIATACALAAWKLKRPVRMYLDRKTDMLIAGDPHPTKAIYSVGFTKEGRITASKGQYKVARTNLPSKTIMMRAPGDVKGALISEAAISHVAAALGLTAQQVRDKIDVITGETIILRVDLLYDCGKSLDPATGIGQVEGGFVQGLGVCPGTEEILTDPEGRQITRGTWLYKPPTIHNIPRVFNVELLNSNPDKARILSSKASGEPPLLLAVGVVGAVREAVKAAKRDTEGDEISYFVLDSPATIDKVKAHCGVDNVEGYLSYLAKQGA